MLSFKTIGNQHLLKRLWDLLQVRGVAERGDSSAPDMLLIGAETLDDAARTLASLDERERAKALIVGLSGVLDIRQPARPGTLAGLLETYRPLGVLGTIEPWKPDLSGFIGPKDLAERTGSGYVKQSSSRRYGAWIRCSGADAGEFVVNLIRALREARDGTPAA